MYLFHKFQEYLLLSKSFQIWLNVILRWRKWTDTIFSYRKYSIEGAYFIFQWAEDTIQQDSKWNRIIRGNKYINLKVHKHEIILNFFWPKSNPYMPFVNFRKKICFFSFDFRQNFDVRTFTRWLSIRGTKFFLRDIQKIFVSKSSLWS